MQSNTTPTLLWERNLHNMLITWTWDACAVNGELTCQDGHSHENSTRKVNVHYLNIYTLMQANSSASVFLSRFPNYHALVQKEKENFVVACLRPLISRLLASSFSFSSQLMREFMHAWTSKSEAERCLSRASPVSPFSNACGDWHVSLDMLDRPGRETACS